VSQLNLNYLGSVADNFGGTDADLVQGSAKQVFRMMKKVWNSSVVGTSTKTTLVVLKLESSIVVWSCRAGGERSRYVRGRSAVLKTSTCAGAQRKEQNKSQAMKRFSKGTGYVWLTREEKQHLAFSRDSFCGIHRVNGRVVGQGTLGDGILRRPD